MAQEAQTGTAPTAPGGRLVEITSEEELRALMGEPAPHAREKTRTALHPLDREWLAHSPFCLVATSAADGTCDVSPKGDPPGFAMVPDAPPSRARLARALERPGESLEFLEEYYGARYAEKIYTES